jgi:hypothetical protein
LDNLNDIMSTTENIQQQPDETNPNKTKLITEENESSKPTQLQTVNENNG